MADGELLRLTTTRKERYVINYRLKVLESRLDPHRFIRLDRGALVNVESINRVTPMLGSAFLVTLANTQQFKVSRAQSRVLRRQLLRCKSINSGESPFHRDAIHRRSSRRRPVSRRP